MSRRASTLNNAASVDVTREIGSKYDLVKQVAERLDSIELLANMEIPALESLVENGIKGLTPSYTFSVDTDGNLIYDVEYIELVDAKVGEW